MRLRLPRRSLLTYLGAVVAPALVLLSLGLESVLRQSEAVAVLTERNLRLSTDRVASALEARVLEAARAVMADRELFGELRTVAVSSASLSDKVRMARDAEQRLRARHPVVKRAFVFRGDAALWPLGRTPLPASLDDLGDRLGPAASEALQLLDRAEGLEALDEAGAVALYRRATQAAPDGPVLALARARLARSELRLGQHRLARDAFRLVVDAHPDEYDLSHQPLGIVAAIEHDRLGTSDADSMRLSADAYQRLVAGRWAVAADRGEYFLRLLEDRLARRAEDRPVTAFTRDVALANALAGVLSGVRPTDDIAVAGAGPGRAIPILYRAVAEDGTLIGVVPDEAWVRSTMLPAVARSIGVRESLTLAPRDSLTESVAVRASLAAVFPGLELVATPLASSSRLRDVGPFAAATAVVVAVLAFGVVLLVRDVARETEMNRMRADFVSGVSHDLKTPTTLIRLYAENLADDPAAPEVERLGFYQIILRETERLGRLIERVLQFSRTEQGQRRYTRSPTTLSAVVSETLATYGPYLRRRGFEVDVSVQPDLPPVDIDAEAVCESLINLLDNAVKYSGDSRRIEIRACSFDEGQALEVRDHGIGISPADQARIFDQFVRSGAADDQGGYGLGLFLVRHVMEAHGGRAEVESEVGRGSVFRLVFSLRG